MTIKAILFDMDGVLIDAKEWHYEALNKALSHFGFIINRDAHLTTYDGLPTKSKLEKLSEAQGLPEGLHEHINKLKQKYTIQYSYKNCKPTFNHRYALSSLSRRFKIAVCSNSISKTINTLMDLSGLTEYIDLFISNEDVEHPKPSPEMFLKAMSKFKVEPSECLIIEDNENGFKAAKESGAFLMKVANPDDVQLQKIDTVINEINGKQSNT